MQEVIWPFLELKVYTAIDNPGKLCVLKLLKIKWNKEGMLPAWPVVSTTSSSKYSIKNWKDYTGYIFL